MNLVGGNARRRYADGIVEAGVEHVHQVGRHGGAGRWRDDVVALRELAADDFARSIGHLDIAGEAVLARAAYAEAVAAVGGNAAAVHVNLGALRRVHGGHDDARAEGFAGIERRGFGQYVGVELVYADVLQVYVGHEAAQHFAFGRTDVALQLGQHGDGGYGRHRLEHVLGPVLADVVSRARHLGAQVRGDDGALPGVGDMGQDALAKAVDAVEQLLTLAANGCQHDVTRCLEVFLVTQVVGIAIGAVGLAGNGPAQLLGEVIKGIGHAFHRHSAVVPGLHLGGIGLQLLGQIGIGRLVLLNHVVRGTIQAGADQVEAFENLIRHVERKHCQQDDVHEIYHLLTGRNGSLFDYHYSERLSKCSVTGRCHRS